MNERKTIHMHEKLSFGYLDQLSSKHGDSFYLIDTSRFKNNYFELINAFRKHYPKTLIGYSYKTNYTPYLCSLIDQFGGLAEVVSDMEYDLALKVGVEPSKIIVNGPYKTLGNLKKYFSKGSLVNLDSYNDFELLKQLVESADYQCRVGLRCNFQITDRYISRFGFDVEDESFKGVLDFLRSCERISFEGIHSHFPDRAIQYYNPRARQMLQIAKRIFDTPPKFIDIGGGYFGKMPEFLANQFGSVIPSYADYANSVAKEFSTFYSDLPEDKKPTLIIEPGSAIVADTMFFVVKVIDIKKINGCYIATTSGSKFNLGSFSSTVNMPMAVFVDSDNDSTFYESIDIAGYTCIESGYLFKGYRGVIAKGAYIVFSNIGSYSVVFKPPFILPNVPIIDINSSTEGVVIKNKETFDDIFSTFNFLE